MKIMPSISRALTMCLNIRSCSMCSAPARRFICAIAGEMAFRIPLIHIRLTLDSCPLRTAHGLYWIAIFFALRMIEGRPTPAD